jgi:hypothetical protein
VPDLIFDLNFNDHREYKIGNTLVVKELCDYKNGSTLVVGIRDPQ